MIHIWDGNTGQGKTYMSSLDTVTLLKRNKAWFEKGKTKVKRRVASNIAIAQHIWDEFPDYVINWTDMEQLVNLRECDIIFDDMGSYLDGQRWMDTPMSVKRWLRLHEHYGCDIYGNAQDFTTIDPSVRRLTGTVTHISKLVGSKRPSATKPAVKFIWGVLVLREVAKEDMHRERNAREYIGWPRIEFIKRKVCETFNTTQDLKQSEWPPLHHIERGCAECGEVKVRHV